MRCEITVGDRMYQIEITPVANGPRVKPATGWSCRLVASMPGKVMRILAREGDEVSAGQGIIVVEAMKMQNEIRSSKAGTLKKLLAREGLNVNAGEVLAIVE